MSLSDEKNFICEITPFIPTKKKSFTFYVIFYGFPRRITRGKLIRKNIILFTEISVNNDTTLNLDKNVNGTKVEEHSRDLRRQEQTNMDTIILKENISLTIFAISMHLLILLVIFFLIVKSNKEAERRLRLMLKYKPSRNWIEPLE